ncbi:hypothetical protein F5B22DRAFT_662609 [Xylaria bambusicola]|uniref:uncharacterized protein n=1 Tax=Xylaria bambusicola TaxID=326684 RepID=UPI00200816BE|nr:uncharacterized protein F5B22DRAFT_662609 [Xylaria bambusicola]KAI0503106.1 hypothetical protein F5B22DRAFT_662609 [Xylaria bambusicola]
MLTPATINIQSFFYPIGNTPAISLTQSLPPGDPANILLLGCRKLDITCCDNQKAVIARNALLLSLIIDNNDGQNDNSLWNIYYHMYLDQRDLDLLRSQSKMLYELSTTMETWQQGKYGRCLSFCDCATLADVRKMWAFYSVEQKGAESARFKDHFQSVLDKVKARHQNRVDLGSINLTGLRSASPAHLGCLQDLNTLNQHYWKCGTTELKADIRSAATHPNPAFLTLGDGAVIHYGTDPLLGFHLAAVDAPLDSTDAAVNDLPRHEKYAALARAEFREWLASYREQFPKNDVRVRFFTGDAISFAHTLQRKRVTSEITAHWYRDRYGVRPLVLDGSDYAPGARAPVQFDVIDTSNLCDHLGSLTLLTATSPLLRDDVSAVLYTEVLARNHKGYKEVLDQVLCGHVPTLSTLLGLFPVEYWSNTSPIPIADEMMLDTLMGGLSENPKTSLQGGQMFLRTSWKRELCMSSAMTPSPRSIPLRFDPKLLAKTLYKVYVHMFLDEDWAYRLSNFDVDSVQKSALVWYQRSSFVSFLRLVQTRVTCNWDAVMESTMDLIEGRSNAPMGMNYYQELNVYLHMLGVYSTDVMKGWSKRDEGLTLTPFLSSVRPMDEKWGDLRDWKNIPPVVCVTFRIPRNKLTVFTNMDLQRLGTPPVHCLLQGSGGFRMRGWQNIFPACQLSFGEVSTLGKPYDDSYEISVQEDDAGWSGTSPLIASFFATTFQLLQQPRDVLVALGVHNSPATVANFLSKLGFTLNVYETTLDNSDAVHVTRFAPNQKGFPVVTGFTRTAPASDIGTGAEASLIAAVDQKTGAMTSLTGRLDIMSSDLKQALTSGCEVKKSIVSPCEVAISLGRSLPLGLCFPVSIQQSYQKLRIARKSSYIEVVTQVADSSEWMEYPEYMFPVRAQSGKPVNFNMPYLNLQKCPVIQITQNSRLQWLVPHLSLAMSARERALREKEDVPRSAGEQVRLNFKESIFSIFVQFAGLQGTKSRVFYLNNAANGGAHVIILASALRLDLSNRAVVLDCAILPLHNALMPDIMGSLAKLHAFGVIVVQVDDAEMRLWRHALPAYVERCRDWTHRDDCEYAISCSVPLNAENGKRVLCSCGSGKLPSNFISNVPGWKGLSKYAVRATISPAFWAPFADDMYSPDLGNLGKKNVVDVRKTSVDGGCASCGKNKQADGGIYIVMWESAVQYDKGKPWVN